jgi:hypothetical protein
MKKHYDVAQIFMSGKKQICIPKVLVGLSLAAALFSAADGTAWAVDTSWVVDSDGNWSESEKWDNGVPGAGDNAFLNQGPHTVKVNYTPDNPVLGKLEIGNRMTLEMGLNTLTVNTGLTIGPWGGRLAILIIRAVL